ncbi:MAG: hypothetical protein KBC84_02070 [Proteobacteria bacterium]|nr:hypothetical protein [Pseudomonadota bacterium]
MRNSQPTRIIKENLNTKTAKSTDNEQRAVNFLIRQIPLLSNTTESVSVEKNTNLTNVCLNSNPSSLNEKSCLEIIQKLSESLVLHLLKVDNRYSRKILKYFIESAILDYKIISKSKKFKLEMNESLLSIMKEFESKDCQININKNLTDYQIRIGDDETSIIADYLKVINSTVKIMIKSNSKLND